jgi:DNA-binding transcriptional LysR family regulator
LHAPTAKSFSHSIGRAKGLQIMDIHHLKVFRAAARTASFTAAGREVSLSQSTVSLHIKELEEEFGSLLFIRSRKRVALSDAGRALLPYVDRVFAELKNAELAVREFSTSQRGTIRLGTGDTPLIYLLPKVLADYRRRFPLIEVVVTTGITEVILQELLHGRIDLGIVMSPSDEIASVEAVTLMKEELVVVLAAEHPLAKTPVLLPRDLAQLDFISHLRGTAFRTVQQGYFDRLGVQPRIIMEVENIEAIKSLVSAGIGVSLLPLCSVTETRGMGLVYKSVRGVFMSRELLIAASDWRVLPPATLRLAHSIFRGLGTPQTLKAAVTVIGGINERH